MLTALADGSNLPPHPIPKTMPKERVPSTATPIYVPKNNGVPWNVKFAFKTKNSS